MPAIKVTNGSDVRMVDETNLDKAKADGYVQAVQVTNGQDVRDVHPSKLEMAAKDGFRPIETQEPSLMRDIVASGAKGMSFGLLPRFAGGLEAGGRAIGIKGLGMPDRSQIELQKPELLEPEKLGEGYQLAKSSYEQLLKGAEERHPTLSGAAEFAGGMVAPIPGAAQGLLGRSLQSAGLGAIQGYAKGESGESDEDRLKKMAKGAAIGSVMPTVFEKGVAPVVGKVAGTAGNWLSEKAKKLGETLSGIPKKAIEVFEKNPEDIQKMYAEAEGNLPNMADKVKKDAMTAIFEHKKVLNGQIETALENSDKAVDVIPIIRSMIDVKARLDPKVKTDKIQMDQIDELINQIQGAAEGVGDKFVMPIQTANRFKKSFQDQAESSYQKAGEIFNVSKDVAKAAKTGAAKLNEQISTLEPSVKEANKILSRLHELDENMHVNLLGVEKPEAALLAAGSGSNQRNANILKELSKITGKDILGDAEKLSAAQYFGDPKWIPVGPETGQKVARQAFGGKLGGLLGAGIGGFLTHSPTGAAGGYYLGEKTGGLLSSPAAVEAVIKLKRAMPNASPELIQALQRGAERGLINRSLKQEQAP